MRTLLVCSLLAALGAAGCSRDRTTDRASDPAGAVRVREISVDQLDGMLARRECQAVDANGDATRKRMGVIPGAVLLRDMDAVDQLPADKTRSLVFYCANTACGASHEAAEKAIVAGYTRVQVLPDGIAGWVKAGKQTSAVGL
ncbi:MAG TPA: rhodanese-like domain-containing protein [Kofleriaceae bacterium]|jgi:rhodanese-related sulfurtransferase